MNFILGNIFLQMFTDSTFIGFLNFTPSKCDTFLFHFKPIYIFIPIQYIYSFLFLSFGYCIEIYLLANTTLLSLIKFWIIFQFL